MPCCVIAWRMELGSLNIGSVNLRNPPRVVRPLRLYYGINATWQFHWYTVGSRPLLCSHNNLNPWSQATTNVESVHTELIPEPHTRKKWSLLSHCRLQSTSLRPSNHVNDRTLRMEYRHNHYHISSQLDLLSPMAAECCSKCGPIKPTSVTPSLRGSLLSNKRFVSNTWRTHSTYECVHVGPGTKPQGEVLQVWQGNKKENMSITWRISHPYTLFGLGKRTIETWLLGQAAA